MTGFASLLAGAGKLDDGCFLDVPDTWLQGRTAYGGFSSALCLAVAQQVGGEALPPLRSAQLAMLAPVYGPVKVTARVERRGRNATWMVAEIHGDKGPAFTASFVFMGPVQSGLHLQDRPLPDGVLTPDEAQPITYTRHTPAFHVNHFEARHALPSDGVKRPELSRWVRLLEDRSAIDPMVEQLLMGDALPPGVMPLMSTIVPVSTMHWQVNMLTAAPQTRDGWWLLRSTGDYAEQGCSSQQMSVWAADGAPVMAGLQSIAVFG